MLIAQLTDLHVRPAGGTVCRVVDTNMLAERALRALRSRRPYPDVVLLTGDLTDAGLAAEYDQLSAMLGRLPSPPLVIPGNHDVRELLRQRLSHLPGVCAHPHFIQYVIDDHPVRIVMLDSVVAGQVHGELCTARLAFLDEQLALAPERPTIVALHHPPFECGLTHMDAINLRNADAFAAVIGRHRQVRRIVSGHHHRCMSAQVAHTVATAAPAVAHQFELTFEPGVTPAIVLEPSSYQLHAWLATTGVVTHTVPVEDFPGPFPFLPADEQT